MPVSYWTITSVNQSAFRPLWGRFNYWGEAFETFGQVFTAPITGALSSFTLSLKGGVGSLYGGVGTWDNANRKSPANLYQSSSVLSPGPAFIDIPVSAPFDEPNTPFTFYPSVSVIAGQQYIAYLSVFGDPVADRYALVYGSDDIVAGIGRFFALNDAARMIPDRYGRVERRYYSMQYLMKFRNPE